MYAEFYNLGENRGVTFPIEGIDMAYGGNLRIRLRDEDVTGDEEPWFFAKWDEESERYWMNGEEWSDFGVMREKSRTFREIPVDIAKQWLVPQ